MKTKDHVVEQFAFLLNNISWLCFNVSKYKATSFYKNGCMEFHRVEKAEVI